MAATGLAGFFYLKKGTEEPAGEHTHGETSNEMCFVDPCDPRLYGKESTKQYDVKEETAMKERFEQWMKQYNKTYSTEKEKAMRYERLFKIACRHVSKPNGLADCTADEYKRYNRCEGFDMEEEYIAESNALLAELGPDEHLGMTSLSPERLEYLMKKVEDRRRQATKCCGN